MKASTALKLVKTGKLTNDELLTVGREVNDLRVWKSMAEQLQLEPNYWNSVVKSMIGVFGK